MKEGTKFLLAVAVLSASAVPSAAQTLPSPDTPPIRVEGDILYNSNVAASSAAFAAERGLARADETYTPSVYVNYVKDIGLESFTLSGQAGYDFYQRNTILNRERVNGTGGFSAEVADCQMTLQGTYARFQSDLQDLSVVATKNTSETISGGLDGTCNSTGKLVPSFSVTQSWSYNSAFVFLTSNYRSLATQGSILYKSFASTDISLLGQYTSTQFPHRLVLSPVGTLANGGIVDAVTGEDGYQLYAGGVKLEHRFGSDLDFQLSVSENSLKTNSNIGPGFSGITYDSSLNYQVGPRLQIKLAVSRSTDPSNRLDATYSIDQDYSVEGDYHLTSKVLFTLGASDGRSTYEGSALIPGTDITQEATKSFFGKLGFDITPRLAVNLTASQDQRHADVVGYDYASAKFGLSISQAF